MYILCFYGDHSISPGMASGEVAQITETRDKLAGISQEEQKVLISYSLLHRI